MPEGADPIGAVGSRAPHRALRAPLLGADPALAQRRRVRRRNLRPRAGRALCAPRGPVLRKGSPMPDRLYFTDSDEANELIATDPMALLIGFALDQQVTVQKAFAGPLVLRERLGSIDARTLADADLEPVFRERPAIHRFPGSMAKRVHELALHIRDEYDGDAARVWEDAKDADELRANLGGAARLRRDEDQGAGLGARQALRSRRRRRPGPMAPDARRCRLGRRPWPTTRPPSARTRRPGARPRRVEPPGDVPGLLGLVPLRSLQPPRTGAAGGRRPVARTGTPASRC